jgi:Mce-associated membrane protein
VASGLAHTDAGRARILLFVNQTTTSAANDAPQVALNRVMLDMVDRDGTWLVDDITSY